MIAEQWYLVLLAGVFALNLLVTYQLYRFRRRGASGTGGASAAGGTSDPVDREDGTVRCTSCDAENELGYRFCRSCVEELPGATEFRRGGPSPLRRMTR